MTLAGGSRIGPYEIVAALGAGGMGHVYTARDTRLDRMVALKVLQAHLAQEADARARFDREARAIAGLNHPNICTLHDVGVAGPEAGEAAGVSYLVMELLEGETLEDRLARGPLDVATIIEYGIALADALEAAHARGVIHRDLKPANIFLTSRGVPKILDFGLAKAIEPADGPTRAAANITATGSTLGTVAYMSPEQLRGEPLDARTDLFSLGLVLFEMATGQRPFPGATTVVVAAGILGQEPVRPRSVRPELPERLDAIILKMLVKDLGKRCQSASELRSELRQVTHAPVVDAPGAHAHVATSSSRSLTPVLIGGVLVAMAAAGFFFLRPRSEPPAASSQDMASATIAPSAPPPTQVEAPPPAPSVPPPAASDSAPVPAPRPAPPAAQPAAPAVEPVTPPVEPAATPSATANARGGARGRGTATRGRGARPPQAIAFTNLANMMRKLPPQQCEIAAAPNPQALQAAKTFQTSLMSGGWTCVMAGPTAESDAALTIHVPQSSLASDALVNWATRLGLEPDYQVVPELQRIRIVVGLLQ